MSTAVLTSVESTGLATPDREEILAEIAQHESAIKTLRQQLPSAVQPFFRFRLTRPANSFVFAYASSLETAKDQVFERLAGEYGVDGFALHPKVDKYNTPEDAANQAEGNLCRCLYPEEARSFCSDYRADHPDMGKKKENRPQVEYDILNFEQQERLNAK